MIEQCAICGMVVEEHHDLGPTTHYTCQKGCRGNHQLAEWHTGVKVGECITHKYYANLFRNTADLAFGEAGLHWVNLAASSERMAEECLGCGGDGTWYEEACENDAAEAQKACPGCGAVGAYIVETKEGGICSLCGDVARPRGDGA